MAATWPLRLLPGLVAQLRLATMQCASTAVGGSIIASKISFYISIRARKRKGGSILAPPLWQYFVRAGTPAIHHNIAKGGGGSKAATNLSRVQEQPTLLDHWQ